ncbi:MAG: methyltransferase domain-containing protein [Planctomycetes bacterium]|nr:methyltransferase domain-containing protein [Planctomycetota bacterium]
MSTELKENYRSWQNSSWNWYAELQFRRYTIPSYDAQEAFLKGYFSDAAGRCLEENGRPLRVLEFGCGFGRHLKYLHQMDGVEVYGCDQSPGMLSVARTLLLGRFPELEERIELVEPDQRLPYEDDAFDIVFTVSVLIHVSPEDVAGRVKELRRVARSRILNVELPPFTHSYLWDDAHGGCWLHDFPRLHRQAGPCIVEVDGDSLAPNAVIYDVACDGGRDGLRVLQGGKWAESPEQVQEARLNILLEYSKLCRGRAQQNFAREAETSRELRDEIRELKRRMRTLRVDNRSLNERVKKREQTIRRLRATRALKFSYWLANHPLLRPVAKTAFDALVGIRRFLPRALGLERRDGGDPRDSDHKAPDDE